MIVLPYVLEQFRDFGDSHVYAGKRFPHSVTNRPEEARVASRQGRRPRTSDGTVSTEVGHLLDQIEVVRSRLQEVIRGKADVIDSVLTCGPRGRLGSVGGRSGRRQDHAREVNRGANRFEFPADSVHT